MVEMSQRIDCVCIRMHRWASQQLAKAGILLWTKALCDASRQTDRREDLWAAGQLHYLGRAEAS